MAEKDDGIFIMVNPGTDHLYELKQQVYDNPYKNEETIFNYDNLKEIDIIKVKGIMKLDNNTDIINLFNMTPYYLKTSRKDIEKLNNITSLDITYDFNIHIFKKQFTSK